MNNKKYAYCRNCRKEIQNPKRIKLDSFHLHILIIASIASLGFGFIAFLIYRFFFQKKKYCPKCREEVEFYDSPEDFPKKIPVINLPISSTQKKIECEVCGEMIESKATVCPFCGALQNGEN